MPRNAPRGGGPPAPITRAALAAWLPAHGYTAETLATALGVSRSGLYHWLAGTRPVPPWLTAALRGLPRRR